MKRSKAQLYIIILSIIISSQLLITEAKYSSKTAYMDRFTESQLDYMNNINNYQIKNCKAEQIYIFLRHGARTPSSSQVNKSKEFLEIYKQFRREELENGVETERILDSVEASFSEGPFFSLSELGATEMLSIANRFKRRYPHLFDPSQPVAELIDVLSSDRSRSVDSALNFIRGLYDHPTDDEDDSDDHLVDVLSARLRYNNTIMRLFDECDRYMSGVKNNMEAGIELTKFANGPEMEKLVENFLHRHSIRDMKFKTSVIRKLFTLCTIELAHRMKENWCKVFDKDDYEILAYHNDLKSYWLKSYGHEINSRVSLLLYKDLFKSIDNFILNKSQNSEVNNTTRHHVLLRFGHAENMIPMIAALNLFRDDDHLLAENFEKNLNRKFRTGNFSPFSANLAFVLHKCGENDDDYKVHVLVNELPVDVIDGGELACAKMNPENARLSGDHSFCDLKHFRAQLEKFINEDHDQVCKLDRKEKTEL